MIGAMKHFLSSTQVAERLGMTRDALNTKIRADAFIPPDVVVGDRYQGWSVESIEKWAESGGGDRIRVDSDKLFDVVTSIRRAAERVRAFGRSPEGGNGTAIAVPSDLHMLAGRLEAEARSWLEVRDYSGKRFRQLVDVATGVTEIRVEFEQVPTLVGSPALPPDVRRLELHAAADEMALAAEEIRRALVAKSSRHYQESLLKKAAQIHEFADALMT
ncbi:hypothetical protein A5751_23060 [Mycolicibacterium fortuitum]|nr:hypothetical protein A5751_23060 [Mycolicibacterium fortuitum]